MSFDLASVLKNVPKLDTAQDQITYIELERLEHDPNNFYELSDIDELAANIEFVGLQQPLRVRSAGDGSDKYIIVSGHRRFAACSKLFNEGVQAYASLPCIIEQSAESEALRELRLIYANSDTRKMTSAELAKQAERVEMLLYQLKEEGVEFPGRMRDHVAEACNLSKSKLARLKVIRDKLIESFRPAYESGELSESAAYRLAQEPEDVQQRVASLNWKPESLTEGAVNNTISKYTQLKNYKCKDGSACTHTEVMWARYTDDVKSHYFCWSCCRTCMDRTSCKQICPDIADEIKREAAEKKAAAKAENDARAKAAEERRLETKAYWLRLGDVREAAGLSTRECYEQYLGTYWYTSLEDQLAEKECGDCKLELYGSSPYAYASPRKISALAERLGVSIEYLFCTSDDPSRASGSPAEAEFSSGKPPKRGRYLALFEIDGSSYEAIVDYESDIDRWSFPFGAAIESPCVAWYPLPDKV